VNWLTDPFWVKLPSQGLPFSGSEAGQFIDLPRCSGPSIARPSSGRTGLGRGIKSVLGVFFLLGGWACCMGADADTDTRLESENNGAPPRNVELAGRLVCLAEEMQRIHGADLPSNHRHVEGFRTEQGEYFTLLETKLSVALFKDPLLKSRQLLLKGRVYPGSRIFDVTLIRSLKNKRIHDVYYWCDICSIKSVVPGECMCCQEEVEFQEKLHDTPGLENIP
jgi:hypothetical protein